MKRRLDQTDPGTLRAIHPKTVVDSQAFGTILVHGFDVDGVAESHEQDVMRCHRSLSDLAGYQKAPAEPRLLAGGGISVYPHKTERPTAKDDLDSALLARHPIRACQPSDRCPGPLIASARCQSFPWSRCYVTPGLEGYSVISMSPTAIGNEQDHATFVKVPA